MDTKKTPKELRIVVRLPDGRLFTPWGGAVKDFKSMTVTQSDGTSIAWTIADIERTRPKLNDAAVERWRIARDVSERNSKNAKRRQAGIKLTDAQRDEIVDRFRQAVDHGATRFVYKRLALDYGVTIQYIHTLVKRHKPAAK